MPYNQRILTKTQVEYMRKHYRPFDEEYGQAALARQYHVSEATIRRAVHKLGVYKDI